MVSNRWNVGDGEIGVMVAGSYARTFNRGDNTPSVGGTQFRRSIRADSAEYAAGVASGLYKAAYQGRSDITYLADVDPTKVAASDRSALISSVGVQNNIAQESYERTRKGIQCRRAMAAASRSRNSTSMANTTTISITRTTGSSTRPTVAMRRT
jgi:hypothetical protein